LRFASRLVPTVIPYSDRSAPSKINGTANSTLGYIETFLTGSESLNVRGIGAVPIAMTRTTMPKVTASLFM
jgi:hypothetical protein